MLACGMSIELSLSKELLAEWRDYAAGAGIPLEYMIIEAVTHSVRTDRLGVDYGKVLKARRQKSVKKEGPTPIAAPVAPSPVVSKESSHSDDLPTVTHSSLNNPECEMAESSMSLDDHIPRNL